MSPILLVEDDENDVFFFKMAAKKAGIERPIIIAGDGMQAKSCLEAAEVNQRPSLVFLDLKLPKMSGVEVLQWVRSQRALATMVIVILTSSEADKDIRACYEGGANSYLVKPSKTEELVHLLKMADQYWFNANRIPSLLARL
jgi:DNA-binding response OmpR family regulator